MIGSQDDLSRLEFPLPSALPIPYIAAPKKDGLKCRKGSYIARQVKKIQAHCRDKHGWQNPRIKGRPAGTNAFNARFPWRENVHCQLFFLSRVGSRWFEVGRQGHRVGRQNKARDISLPSTLNLSAETVHLTPEVRAHLQSILQREQRHRSSDNQPRACSKAMGEDSLAATSPWLERTQWPAMFMAAGEIYYEP